MCIVIFMIVMAVLLSISFNKNISDSDTPAQSNDGMSIFIMVIMMLFMIGTIISQRNNKVTILGNNLNKGMIIYIFIAFMIMFSSKMNKQ